MPTVASTPFPAWVPTKSKQHKSPGVEGDEDEKVVSKIYVCADPDDDGGALGEPFSLPVSDYDYGIDGQGNICPVVMSTNRVDSRDHCESNHPALQKKYKSGKGWMIFPDYLAQVDGKFTRVPMPRPVVDGKHVSKDVWILAWIEKNRELIEKRRAKHNKAMTRTDKAWIPADEKMAASVVQALKDEREAHEKVLKTKEKKGG